MRQWIALALLLSQFAMAGTVSRVTDFLPDTLIESEDVNAEFDNIISALNGNLDGSNIIFGAIATANIATAAVTTSKINDGAVTAAKMAPLGYQLSSATNQTLTGITTSNITALTVTITSYGRPIFVGLVPEDMATANLSFINVYSSGPKAGARIYLTRNSAAAGQWLFQVGGATANLNVVSSMIPSSALFFIDATAAGTYIYQLKAAGFDAGSTVEFNHIKMIAYEL